jgi:hypothetical protein
MKDRNLYPADRYVNAVVNYAVRAERRRKRALDKASARRRARPLQGVQRPLFERFPKLAYRVTTNNGSAVLCDKHLDLLRATEPAALTGETFAAGLCDHCAKEEEL